VVIIGLVALSTVLFLYLADESNRQDAEVKEQDDASIERGMDNYLQYCLPCHGPAGEGYEEGTGRIGAPLGGSNTSLNQEGVYANGTPYPGGFSARTALINKTIHEGRPQLGMPVWGADNGGELNDDQINNLTYMIQHVDWNEVYNKAIEVSGGYPTVAPTKAPTVAPTPSEGAAAAHLEAYDIGWNPNTLQIGTGPQKIEIKNTGSTMHDFSITKLNIHVELPPGQTTTVDIDAPAGEYEFYCSVPGHKEAGMVGKLVVEEGAGLATPSGSPTGATPAAGGGTPAAAATTIDLQDIRFVPAELTVQANTPTTISLSNTGASLHNFSIDELHIKQDVQPGQTVEVVINAPAGEYKFYCDVPGHEAAGMVGTLTVK
jgi:nitrite reductase (NO-forming)